MASVTVVSGDVTESLDPFEKSAALILRKNNGFTYILTPCESHRLTAFL